MNFTRLNPLTLAEKLTGRTIGAGTRHYFKDSFFYTAANVIPRLMGFILTPIVTGLLTTGEYNTFNIFSNTVITMLCLMISIQAENSVARYYYDNKDDFPEFLGSLFLFTAALGSVMLVQFWFFRAQWSWVFFGQPEDGDHLGPPMFLWGLGCAVAQILHQVYLSLLLVQKRSRSYFFWNFLKNFLYVVFALHFLLRPPGGSLVFGLVYAYAGATGLLAAPFLVFIVRRMRLAFQWRHIGYAMRFSLPGLPGALALLFINFFDRLLFQHNNKDLGGQYTFAYTIGWLILMATTGLFSAYMPRFYENMNKGLGEANQKIFSRNFKLLLLGGLTLTLISQPFAHLLGRSPDYLKGLPIIPIVISAYIFMYLGQCYGLYIAFRRKHILLQSGSQIIAAVLNVSLNVWIWKLWPPPPAASTLALAAQAPVQGALALAEGLTRMRAIALATLIPYFVQWLIVYLIARFLLREKIISFQGLKLPLLAYLAFSAFWSYFGYTLFTR